MDAIEVGVFRDERATEAHLRTKPEGHCSLHPSSTVSDGRLRGSTMSLRAGGVVLTPVDEPVSDRINLESSDGQMRIISQAISGRPELAHLAADGYAIKPLGAGASGEFQTTGAHFLFSGCIHSTEACMYFDLVACSGARVTSFAHKHAVPWLRHSGDKLCPGLLVHTLSLVEAQDDHAVLCAVGYCYKPLCEFADLSPYMAMVDVGTRTIWVVPFSLDRESVGHESTLIAPLAIRVTGTRVRYVVPERLFHMPGVNTGMCPPELARFVSADKLGFERAWRARLGEREQPREERGRSEVRDSPLVASMRSTRVTVMLENGLEPPDAPWGAVCLVRLGTTLEVSVPASRPERAAPSAFYAPVFPGSTASGTQRSLLLCTHSADLSTERYREHVASVPTVVYVTAGAFKEADVGASHHRIHGVMVVVGARLDDLASLSVPAMRLMGARSVVLYFDSERHYFLRGAPGIWRFLPRALAFGAEVEFAVDSISARAHWPYISLQADRGVLFHGAIVGADAVLAAVRAADPNDPDPELACALAQLRVVLDAAETRDLKSELVAKLAAHSEAIVAPIRARRAELVRALVEDARADPELGTLKHAEREARRQLRALADLIESVCSERVASSRASASLDLQCAARRDLIAQRVDEAARMSDAEFGELLAFVPFFAIAEATPHIEGLLRAVSSPESMEASLVALAPSTAPVRLSTRAVTLDGDTVAAVVEYAPDVRHVLEAASSVAFPMGGRSCVPFAVTDAALSWDGGGRDWMRDANERAAQLLRIKLRGCFAGIRQFAIDPASRELTLALVAMLLSLAQSVCARGVAAERDETTQQMLRGVLHLLFSVSASGSAPALWVFQLTQPQAALKLPASPGQWNVYAGVLECLVRLAAPETARADVRRAACALVCLALRRGYADAATEPLRAGVGPARADAQAHAARLSDERRQWARAAMLVLWPPVDAPDEDFFATVRVADPQGAARSLLASAPHGMRAYRRALAALAKGDSEPHDVRRETAKYFSRWSGAFADAKAAVLHGADLSTLDARAELVARVMRVGVVVTNYATFASGDRARMAGDAELARLKWPTGAREWCGRAPLDVDPTKTWRALLGAQSEGHLPSAGAEAPPRVAEPEREVPTLDVVARAARVPIAPLTRILEALGLEADDAREAVRILLRNWRDANAADAAATAYLVARAG